MRNILILQLVLSMVACSPSVKDDREAKKIEIMNTDRAFSALSAEKGMREAFISFAADEVIKPQPGGQPIVGRESLLKSFEGTAPDDFVLTWEPIKADVSGDLGYTFGNWKRRSKDAADTTYYGNYISIWKRQADGTWKYVFDSGNSTSGPTSLE